MSESPAIDRLVAADVGPMRALNELFARAFNDPDTYGASRPSDAYLAELLSQPKIIALAARIGSIVAGGLVAYELQKFERERREIYIYDLAVDEPWRRQGIATKLINQLQTIAAARGAYVIYVQADYGDAAAISLYEKLGLREDVMHFDIPVPDKP